MLEPILISMLSRRIRAVAETGGTVWTPDLVGAIVALAKLDGLLASDLAQALDHRQGRDRLVQ